MVGHLLCSYFDKMNDCAESEGAGGLGSIMYEADAPKGPIARDLEPGRTEAIRATCWMSAGDAVFFVAGKSRFAGSLRNAAGRGVEPRPAPVPPDHRLPDVRAPRGDRSGRFGGMLEAFR